MQDREEARMQEKMPGPIQEVRIDEATFHKASFKPTLINFIYGKNGSGKTTISRAMNKDGTLIWSTPTAQTIAELQVFNQDFIHENIEQSAEMPGVFTVDAKNIETMHAIDEQEISLKANLEKIEANEKEIEEKKKVLAQERKVFENDCWEKTEEIRRKFPKAFGDDCDKASFADTVLKQRAANKQPQDLIKYLYEHVYNPRLKTVQSIKTPKSSLPTNVDILSKPLINSGNSAFAMFMKSIEATDWVRQGHEKFYESSGGICPYCQQKLPGDFVKQLVGCFDEEYDKGIEQLQQFSQIYQSSANEILQTYEKAEKHPYLKERKEIFHSLVGQLAAVLQLNINNIEEKKAVPSKTVSLEDTASIIKKLNREIEIANESIYKSNSIVTSRSEKEDECKGLIWSHIGWMCSKEARYFGNLQIYLSKKIKKLDWEIKCLTKETLVQKHQIRFLREQITDTKIAVHQINDLLQDAGFQNFFIREKEGDESKYEIIRLDGTPVGKSLSEGEQNFIAFLYFYQIVLGRTSIDSVPRNKIVVIDDPVSSLDSSAMFIVSSIIRGMIEVCRNNAAIEPDTQIGNYIKQIFLLTHNTFFHREVTYCYEKYWECVSFFLITKKKNESKIELKTTRDPKREMDIINLNPVVNSYAALWREYLEVDSGIALINVIRRILESYFIQMCGYDGMRLKSIIIDDNREKFVRRNDDGTLDHTRQLRASAMLSYLSTTSCGIADSMYFVDDITDLDVCRDIFEEIFQLTGHEMHYRMMMEQAK